MGEVSAGDEIAGRYRLVKLLGSGGQGEVWEATSLTVTTLRVALKRVRHEGDGAQRAVEEAEKLARVRHAHVVAVHDVVTEGDDHWIVMGYIAGQSLKRLGRISVEQAATYGAQLADGLAAVHAQGLLHRDVTPSNVLVADGVATLVDFGIADSVSDAVTVTGTTGAVVDPNADVDADGDADAAPAVGSGGARISGTPGYLAPEMLVPGTQYRRPADVFGLGATLYWALEGVTPFEDGGPTSPAAGSARQAVRTPRRSGAMADVVVRMLHKNPRERPALEDVRDELRSIAAGENLSAPPQKARKGRALAAVAAAVVLVVAGALFTWNAYGPPADGVEQAAGPARAGLRAQPEPPSPSPKATAEKTPAAEPSAEVVADPAPSPSRTQNADGGATQPKTGTAAATPITFAAKSGDAAREASWDPCKLLDAGTLNGFGAARIDSDRGEFQGCDATVSNGSGVSEVELTMYVDEDPDGSGSDQGGGVTLYSSEGDDECAREVVFGAGDRYNLSFEATQIEGSGADLCAMAQSVADRTAALVAADDLPVRTALPMPGSAIGRNTCDLPSDDALRTALDIDDMVSPQREFAEWDCKWDGDESRYLRLLFERNEGYAPDDGTRTSLSGHTAYERGDAWGEGCLVDVVAKEGPSPEGDGRVSELLRVHLTGESDQETLCDDAVTVARSAAAGL
ncbi:serine/threonine-protein kinase [Promicromonospora panici]|uniref:serine/threonine-protein kinase n=1 Tax=Promicromonospora panici TaxID=2219658 RepID=UPI0013EB75DC|nr:serine/threonine-protein kinase [Promicromonospora panici]